MNYKSHTENEITAALLRGEQVWALDTANRGDDDHLIGTYEAVLSDVLYQHELEELPAEWSLDRVPAPDYVIVFVSTVFGRSIGETGFYQRHVAYLPQDEFKHTYRIRELPEVGELRYVEMIEKSADHDEGGPLDLVLARVWKREAFIEDQCAMMNGHHGAVYAAFGRG